MLQVNLYFNFDFVLTLKVVQLPGYNVFLHTMDSETKP